MVVLNDLHARIDPRIRRLAKEDRGDGLNAICAREI